MHYYTTYLGNCILFKIEGYSFLGLATIAIKNQELPKNKDSFNQPHLIIRDLWEKDRLKVQALQHNPIQVPFNQKKEHIQELLKLDFQLADKDKYFALLAKYEEYGPSIITKKMLLQYSQFLSEIELPQEIIDYISLLMFETEESLL